MENWPEYAICETSVVFQMVLSREIERNVGNFFVDNFLCCNPAMRRDPSTPAKPNAGFLFQGSIDCNFKPAARALVCLSGTGTRFETTISCPNGDPFRYAFDACQLIARR